MGRTKDRRVVVRDIHLDSVRMRIGGWRKTPEEKRREAELEEREQE